MTRSSRSKGREPTSGVGLAIYRLLWLTLLAASLASTAYFNPRSTAEFIRVVEAGHAIGFTVWTDQSAVGALGSPLGEEGRTIGFREGDLVLTVDGRRLPGRAVEQGQLLSGPPGSMAVVVGRHDDGTPFTLRAVRDPARTARAYAGSGLTFAGRTWFVFAIDALAALVSLGAAVLLFLRRPRDPVAQLLSFALVLSRAGLMAQLPGAPDVLAAMWESIATTMVLLAVLLFPHHQLATRWHGLALATILSVDALQLIQWLASTWSYWTALALVAQAAVVSVAVARQLQLAPPGIQRQQTKFVLFGIAAYAVLLAFASIMLALEFVPINAGIAAWFTLMKRVGFALGGLAIPVGLLVSLLRYRLYDAETAISRSVAYGALTAALVAVFAGSQKVIEMLGEAWFGGRLGAVASALAAAIAAATIAPLHHRVTGWAERRFRGGLVHLRQGLPLLVGDLRETAEPSVLADAMLARVQTGVRAVHGAVVAGATVIASRNVEEAAAADWLMAWDERPDGSEDLEIDRGDPAFPMRVSLRADGVGHVGWLLLGPRPDGSFYGKDERETLMAIADPVARALSVAIERERQDFDRREREGSLKQLVDALCRVVQDRLGIDVHGLTTVPMPATTEPFRSRRVSG